MSDERQAIDFESWHEEKTSAWLYGVASASESDPVIKQMFLDLADAAEVQAAIVARDMSPAPTSFKPPTRARLVALLTRALSPRRTRLTSWNVRSRPPPINATPVITSWVVFWSRLSMSKASSRSRGFPKRRPSSAAIVSAPRTIPSAGTLRALTCATCSLRSPGVRPSGARSSA